ncbi:mannitol dehydrogenase family protein [Corynebacterium uterequi]|uniref:Mannitol-1-phosphate/altronate dehydrogenase n=1 Tax=Corynebacterium uterequi TaxID=1072256 RepID=A0A0G3HKV7_9CORY|nr:mannitol dehydrogenase family protein [Corynebacterium uterequi]AKK11732.1 mannitol-1-phosphate/altronate dehydrogenase [Corynebacterium uterequi]
MSQPLNRSTYDAAPAAPVRLVHLGLGAFHRAHQVWYTAKAEADPKNPQFGYCSFTGRSPRMSDKLTAQDSLYTLVTRSGESDSPEVIETIVEAQPAANIERLAELIASKDLVAVTLTVTEAGYHLAEGLKLDTDSADVQADIAALKADITKVDTLATAAGKIVYGLAARRAAGNGGLAIMSCDNIAANGATARASVLSLANEVDPELKAWIEENVTFPSSSIDRITPATEDSLIDDVEKATGFRDEAPVVTEPFASWVIEGEFPNGRPDWEKAGAQFVEDIEQFENRKLWLLNGSHSLMAYYGQLRGHATVAEAIGDEDVRARVNALWDEAANHLTAEGLDIPGYRDALIERFENPRIRHNLAQIGIDGGTKQRMRAVPIMKAELADGRDGDGAAFSIAGWIAYLLRDGGNEEIKDTRADDLDAARKADDPVAALVAALDEELAANEDALARIRAHVESLTD